MVSAITKQVSPTTLVAALGLKTDVYDCLNDLSEILFSCLKDIGDGWPDPKLFIKDEILLKSMIPHMYEQKLNGICGYLNK